MRYDIETGVSILLYNWCYLNTNLGLAMPNSELCRSQWEAKIRTLATRFSGSIIFISNMAESFLDMLTLPCQPLNMHYGKLELPPRFDHHYS